MWKAGAELRFKPCVSGKKGIAVPAEPKRLIVEDLVKTYQGRCVVDHVSLELHEARIVGLLGPNVSGIQRHRFHGETSQAPTS